MNYKELQVHLKEMGASVPLNSPKSALQAEFDRLSSAIVPIPKPSPKLESLTPTFQVVATERRIKLTEYVPVFMDTGTDGVPIYTQCWVDVEGFVATCTRLPEAVRQHLGTDVPVLGVATLICAVKRDGRVFESKLHVADITESGVDVTIEARCDLNPDEVKEVEKVLSKKFCLHSRVLAAHTKAEKSQDRVSSRKKIARKMSFN